MTSVAKKVVSNSTILMGADIFNKALRMVLVVFSARLLGDENYGKFSFALAFTILFLIIADLGIHQLLVRELARKPDQVKKYLGNALVIKFFLAVVNLLLIFAIINFTHKPSEVVVTVYILAAYQILGSFGDLFKAIFQAFQQMKYDALITVFQAVIDTALGVGILLLGGDFKDLAWMYLLGSGINLTICMAITVRKFTPLSIDVDLNVIKFLFHEGLPFGILFFFAMMYTYISSVLLSLMVDDQVVGWYNAAYRLVAAMLFIPMGTMKAVFPALSKYYNESIENFNRLFEKTFKIMFFIGFSLASLVSLLADKIILLLYGKEYINATPALQILVWSTALIFITTVMTHATRSSDRQRFTAKAVGFSALLNVTLNLILIPKYSYIGAAIATLVTEGSTFVLHLFYLSNKLTKPPFLKLAPKILTVNLVMGSFIFFFNRWDVFTLAITATLVNLVMVVLIRFFSKEEYMFLKNLLRLQRV